MENAKITHEFNDTLEYEYYFISNEENVKVDIKYKLFRKYIETSGAVDYLLIIMGRIYADDYNFMFLKSQSTLNISAGDNRFYKDEKWGFLVGKLDEFFSFYDKQVPGTYLNDFDITIKRDEILKEFKKEVR